MQAYRPTRFRRFASLGDGFTAGVDGDLSVPWPAHAARALADHSGELVHRNFAAAGATGIDVAIFQLQRTAEFEPDLVSVICGANDVLSARADPEVFTAVFDGVVDSLRRRLPEALIVTATYPRIPSLLRSRRERTDPSRECSIETVNTAIREIASRRGLVCLDWPDFAQQGFTSSAEDHRRVGTAFAAGLARWAAKPSDRSARR